MTDQNGAEAEMPFSDPDSVQELWDEYYVRLRAAVSHRVRSIRRPVASESEVILSALNSFVWRARDGQFPQLADHDELWRLLKTIAIRKANDLRKNLRAQKRGGDKAIYNQADLSNDSSVNLAGVDVAPGNHPAPSLDMEVSEMFNSLLNRLPDDRHRDVILLKLQGAPVALIAEHLSTTTRTVQRLIKKIEEEWQDDLLAPEPHRV